MSVELMVLVTIKSCIESACDATYKIKILYEILVSDDLILKETKRY